MTTRRRSGWTIPTATRDSILFIGGIAGILNEVLFHHGEPQPQFLVIYVGLIASIPLAHIRDRLKGP